MNIDNWVKDRMPEKQGIYEILYDSPPNGLYGLIRDCKAIYKEGELVFDWKGFPWQRMRAWRNIK